MIAVTTLIPVYNGAEFIADAVDAALNQVDVDNEVIVIDDESTDATPDILRHYGTAIRVLRQKNGGHVNARNNGAKLASGEWLAFLDADDLWTPDKLSKQLAAATPEVGMVYTNRLNFGEIDRVAELQSDAVEQWRGDVFEPLLFGNFVTVASVVMRKEWFKRLGGFDEELLVCEDWDMWLRFAAAGGLTEFCPEPLTKYRWHASSMSNNQERMCHGRLKVVRRALESERGRQVLPSVAKRALAACWKCSAWHAAPWRRATALRWYARAACHWPWDGSVYKQMLKCCMGMS